MNLLIRNIFCSFCCLFAIGCAKTTAQSQRLNATVFKQQLDSFEAKQVIDVRTPQEFAQGHIAGAININYHNPQFKELIKALPKDQTTFIYCHSGGRSRSALKSFEKENFKSIYELKGGMSDWKREKFPTEK